MITNKHNLKKAFTLIELVVTIAVIAILTAVSVGSYFAITISSNHSRCKQEALSFYNNLKTEVIANQNDSNSMISYEKDGFLLKEYNEFTLLEQVEDNYPNQRFYPYTLSSYESTMNITYDDKYTNIMLYAINVDEGVMIKYIGYLSTNLSLDYIKFIDCTNDEFVESFNGTFINYDDESIVVNSSITDLASKTSDDQYNEFIDDEGQTEYMISKNNMLTNFTKYGYIRKLELSFNDESNSVKVYGSNVRPTPHDLYGKHGYHHFPNHDAGKCDFPGCEFYYNVYLNESSNVTFITTLNKDNNSLILKEKFEHIILLLTNPGFDSINKVNISFRKGQTESPNLCNYRLFYNEYYDVDNYWLTPYMREVDLDYNQESQKFYNCGQSNNFILYTESSNISIVDVKLEITNMILDETIEEPIIISSRVFQIPEICIQAEKQKDFGVAKGEISIYLSDSTIFKFNLSIRINYFYYM